MNELLEPLLQNQFLTGGALLGGVAGAVALLRQVPGKLYDWAWRGFTIELTIRDTDEVFAWLAYWLHHQPYSKDRARNLHVGTRWNNKSDRREVVISPGEGQHWFFYKGVLILLNRVRNQKGGVDKGFESEFSLTLFTKKRQYILDLLNEANELVNPPEDDRISLFAAHYGEWYSQGKLLPRSLDSVILKKGQVEELLADIEKFISEPEWYRDRGLPYRRGYLLHGTPGNGKSSVVKALASQLKRPLYLLSLSSKSLDDDNLRELLRKVPEHGIVLIEDVDCAFEQREKGEDDSVLTFAGLINALDGVAAAEGRLLFMTTNYLEKLDSALIRPGRVDVPLAISDPDREQLERMFLRFFPDRPLIAECFSRGVPAGRCMAAIQNHFIQYRDPVKACSHASEI